MKSNKYAIIALLLISIVLFSCENTSDSSEGSTKVTEVINKKDASKVVMAIDSNAINVVKRNPADFKVIKDEKPATQAEINQMVSKENQKDLNEYQKVVQSFLKACAEKDFNAAASLLAYNGTDVKRKHQDAYDLSIANEVQIVKSTVDVVYGFMLESKDYEFITYNEKSTPKGTYATMEVSFFKKGMGINRRQFDVADTKGGKLIVDMR